MDTKTVPGSLAASPHCVLGRPRIVVCLAAFSIPRLNTHERVWTHFGESTPCFLSLGHFSSSSIHAFWRNSRQSRKLARSSGACLFLVLQDQRLRVTSLGGPFLKVLDGIHISQAKGLSDSRFLVVALWVARSPPLWLGVPTPSICIEAQREEPCARIVSRVGTCSIEPRERGPKSV